MDKKSKTDFLTSLAEAQKQGIITNKMGSLVKDFYESYRKALKENHFSLEEIDRVFLKFFELIKKQITSPYLFPPYHQKIRSPFDYYQFGLDFLRPLIDKTNSSLLGKEHLVEIENHLKQNHNIVFFANHQTEADPQAIALLLENDFPMLSEKFIIVAGERVITDPLAVPFSLGCDLLCIYSKRYINHPPEQKLQKQMHNKKTMQLMSNLLKEGGKCIYVAPSGGRDRRNAKGKIEIAPFDPKSIEMFYLMSKKSKTPTFFYPMALKTFDFLPPPKKIQKELGERRFIQRAAIHLAIGSKIDMDNYPNSDHSDKDLRRKSRSHYIWELVKKDYRRF